MIDTNVLVSGLLSPAGNAAQINDLVAKNKFNPVLSHPIVDEYRAVLSRKVFGFPPDTVEHLISDYLRHAAMAAAGAPARALPDAKDQIFLDAALGGQADCIVTGNLKDFPAIICEPVKVVSPKAFIGLVQERSP